MIDIRSDTVTKPSVRMLEIMMSAKTGDDVFGEDETANLLQKKCAELSGKEDSLFVPTGVMGNQLAIKCHTIPGDEVIVERESHILNYETAAPSVISNVQLLPVNGDYGVMNKEEIAKHIRTSEYYFPVTRLICIENTHNRAGGTIQPIDSIKSVSSFAKDKGIKTHLDGARIFNASMKTGITLKEYASYFDSVSFCFSKGLGCPVGSILCGSREFISTARKWRKILGAGMRQVGILAAAAIYALENNIQRLSEDNEKAFLFANEISKIPGIYVDMKSVQTNIVIFHTDVFSKNELIDKLKSKGILVSSGSYNFVRAVFHMDVSMKETEESIKIIKSIFN
ncbi:MAG: L-allo-threonine aldolase [Ignavibacteria bacterium]|nr:L-allo-threonine aldolase [Ignavibacteria bacterium]